MVGHKRTPDIRDQEVSNFHKVSFSGQENVIPSSVCVKVESICQKIAGLISSNANKKF